MARKRLWLTVALLIILGLGVAFIIAIRLPKPQMASVEGKTAPDFTLKDQDGQSLQLSSLRGSRVLLIFYRGYW